MLEFQNTLPTGFGYFTSGMNLLMQSGMKRFVLIPVLANVIVFFILTGLLIQYFSSVSDWFTNVLSFWSWLTFIATFVASILSGVIFFTVLLIYGYSFNIITNIIAAPFYGILAEKLEAKLTGATFPKISFNQMLIRTLKREMVKLWYFTTRGILVVIALFFLSFIPLVNFVVPFLGLLWAAWVMTLQYTDYPADNNQLGFKSLRQKLKKHYYSTTGFGSTIMFGSMIPAVNIFVMPIAVAGGTLFWTNELSKKKNSIEVNN